jgi:hypothetical protein
MKQLSHEAAIFFKQKQKHKSVSDIRISPFLGGGSNPKKEMYLGDILISHLISGDKQRHI